MWDSILLAVLQSRFIITVLFLNEDTDKWNYVDVIRLSDSQARVLTQVFMTVETAVITGSLTSTYS